MTQLPRDTPAGQGVDPAAILGFLDAVDADPAVELHGLMVLRHGHVVAEGWWAPHTAERTRLLYSISKSFTSTALAFAVEEGLVGLDDTVLDHFPEYADEDLSAYTRATTLRHLASMASGHGREMWLEALAADPQGAGPRLPDVPTGARLPAASSPTASRAPTRSRPRSSAGRGSG